MNLFWKNIPYQVKLFFPLVIFDSMRLYWLKFLFNLLVVLRNGSRASCMLAKYTATEQPSSPWTLSEAVLRTLYIYPCSSDKCPLHSSLAKGRPGIGLLSCYLLPGQWSHPCLLRSQHSFLLPLLSARGTGTHHPAWFVHCWGWTQGFLHALQALYQLSHISSLVMLGWQKASAMPFLVLSWLNVDRALYFHTVDVSGYCHRQWCRNNCQHFDYCAVPDGSTLTHWLYEAGINPTLQKRNPKSRSCASVIYTLSDWTGRHTYPVCPSP